MEERPIEMEQSLAAARTREKQPMTAEFRIPSEICEESEYVPASRACLIRIRDVNR